MCPLPCVQWSYFPYTETRFCNLGKRQKEFWLISFLINKIMNMSLIIEAIWKNGGSTDFYIYSTSWGPSWNQTNMMQGGFDVKSTSMEILCHRVPLTEFVLLEMTVKWWTTKCRLKHLVFFPYRTDALIIDRMRIGSHPVWFEEVLVIGSSAEALHFYTCGAER